MLVVITSTCAACAASEIHIPFSTMAAALGTPTALPLPVSYREVGAQSTPLNLIWLPTHTYTLVTGQPQTQTMWYAEALLRTVAARDRSMRPDVAA